MSRLTLLFALPVVAVAAWLSQGTLAFTGVGSSRLAVLPLSVSAAIISGGAAALAWAAWRAGASLAPLLLLALLALPWVSASGPAASTSSKACGSTGTAP